MSAHQTPEFYKKLLSGPNAGSNEEIQQALIEIREILTGMEKGLKVLTTVGKKPEKKVLENQAELLALEKKFKALIDSVKKG